MGTRGKMRLCIVTHGKSKEAPGSMSSCPPSPCPMGGERGIRSDAFPFPSSSPDALLLSCHLSALLSSSHQLLYLYWHSFPKVSGHCLGDCLVTAMQGSSPPAEPTCWDEKWPHLALDPSC